jgi:hypothetical protein
VADNPSVKTWTSADVVTGYASVIERVDALNSMLAGDEQSQARRVVSLARDIAQRERSPNGQLATLPGDLELRKELARSVELLGRRGARAIASATLGRAVLADLSSDRSGFRQACRECDEKLLAFGL